MANGVTTQTQHVPFLAEKGFRSWILSTDHKRIGILYLLAISFFFAVAGITALGMRYELMTPELEIGRAHV